MENNNYALVSADERGTVLALRGNVTQENSNAVEGGMLALRAAHPSGSLSIDASVLEDISTEGLNMLMRMRRNEENMRIFNVSNEIYNTLRSNGITKLVKVEKSRIAQ